MTRLSNLKESAEFISPDYPLDFDLLSNQFDAFDAFAVEAMVSMGCGHLSLCGLLGASPEHTYMLLRMDTGIKPSDDWNRGKEKRCCLVLERFAKSQGLFI